MKDSVTVYSVSAVLLLGLAAGCQTTTAVSKELSVQHFGDGRSEEAQAEYEAISAFFDQVEWPSLEQIPEFRKALDVDPPPPPEGVVIEPVESGPVPMEWVYGKEASAKHVLLYFHGGAYVLDSAKSRRPLVTKITLAAGVRVLSVDYALAPEHSFPAALEDAKKAYQWLLDEGYSPNAIVLGGDSAGGGLALATLVALKSGKTEMPAGAVLLAPWTDLAMSGKSNQANTGSDIPMNTTWITMAGKAYAGEEGVENPLVSPLYADLSGLPPLLVQAGSSEMLLDDSTRVAKKAHQEGVDVTLQVYKGMWHVFQHFGGNSPEAQKAVAEIAGFLKNRTQ